MTMAPREQIDKGAENGPSPETNSLIEAFSRFQEHCERLDSAQLELRKRLAQAELQLDEKNRELAARLQELDTMKGRLSAVIESIPDALFLIDERRRVELLNSAAQQLFPQAGTDVLISKTIPELGEWLNAGEDFQDAEIVLTREDGPVTLVATLSPLVHSEETSEARILVLRNVTEYRRLKERLARDNRLAALGEVAANVAHEIRNPLGAIEGFGRLLQSDLKETRPGADRLLSRMVFAANQMNCVVSNLLNFARPTTPTPTPGDMAILVREVMDMMELKAAENGVEVSLDVHGDSTDCTFDPVRMKEVITNLVANAIQACPPRGGGVVRMTLQQRRAGLEFSVNDNGRGIPEASLQRIFEPFYTLKNDGVGLGLALCKRIVEEHEGSISARNNVEGGAQFTLLIPETNSPRCNKPGMPSATAEAGS